MTYSRPGTSTVNALFQPAKQQPMPAADRRVITVGDNGRFLDFSNPELAAKNAGRDAAAVSNFLNNALQVGAPVYKAFLEDQATKQVGEFLKTTDVSTLYAKGTKEQRDILKTYNVFAQQQVADAAARYSTRSYLEVLQAERSKDATLQNPYASPAEQAQAKARVRATAMDRSGINQLPPSAIASYLPSIAEAEATLEGESYKQRLATQSSDFDLKVEKGLGTNLITIDESRKRAVSFQASSSIEKWNNYKTGAVASIQRNHDQYLQGGVYTSKQYAERWWSAVVKEYQQKIGNDDLPGAFSLINTVSILAENNVSTPGGVSLWDIKLGDGTASIKDGINRLNADLTPKLEAWERKQLIKQAGPDLARMAQGDEQARTRLEAMLPSLSKDPEALQSVVGMMGQMQSFSRTPTEGQLRQQGLLEIDLNNPNRNQGQFSKKVLGSDLTWEQKISLLNRNTQPQNPALALVSQGAEYGKDELLSNAAKITQAQQSSGLVPAGVSGEELLKRNYQDLQIAATRATEKRIKDLLSAGETVTPMRAAEIFRNEQEAIRNTRMKEARVEAPSGLSWDQTVMGEMNYVQSRLQQTSGKGTIAVFPPAVIAASKAAGIPQDYRNVQRYFLNRIATAKDGKGQPMFSDPQKAYQQAVQNAQPKSQGKSATEMLLGNPFARAPQLTPQEALLGKTGVQTIEGLIQLGRKIGLDLGGDAPKAQPKRQSDQSSAGPVKGQQVAMVPQPMQQLLTRGLESLMNVVAPPAMASEGPGGAVKQQAPRVVYEMNLPEMAKIWSGYEKLSAQTAALPQIAANALAAPIGLAINNVMHPFFVAIGINEGTRTPDGRYTKAYYGHTDPGNGALNVGTVSGQQGGSPQSTDRRWMGILTQKQLQVAPLLQRLGVAAGTVGYNRLMFNALDLAVQAPAALPDFLRQLPRLIAQGSTIEAIAKARANAFINPATGQLEASGFGNSYSRLLSDQRSRAGAFDYKRRL